MNCKAGCGKHAYRDTGLCGDDVCRWKFRAMEAKRQLDDLLEAEQLRSKADRDALAQWARDTHRLVVPERVDLVLWLMQQVERLTNHEQEISRKLLERSDEVKRLQDENAKLRSRLDTCADCGARAEAGYSERIPLCGKCWTERAVRH